MVLNKLVWLTIAMLVLGFSSEAGAGQTPGITPFTYTVKQSDDKRGLSGVADRLCGDSSQWSNIAKANRIEGPNFYIHVGQKLNIPCLANTTPQVVVIESFLAHKDPATSASAVVYGPRLVTDSALKTVPATHATSANTAPRRASRTKLAPRSSRTSQQKNQVVQEIASYWQSEGPDEVQRAAAILTHESSLVLDAQGWNCWYSVETDQVLTQEQANALPKNRKRSMACKKRSHRVYAWSVDCGIAQINQVGQYCRPELMTLHGNLRAAKEKYDAAKNEYGDGFLPWVSYKEGRYRKFLPRYQSLARDMETSTNFARMNQMVPRLVTNYQP